ncbi:MAG TPA: HAD-IA family hydrolase [Thermoanaerobaculia bacterium]|nr:HAD-IA family hydrolase [Thermoanaerobaculia bacterium]
MSGARGLVVFDLDGTLVDGYAGISDALGFAMRRMGLLPPTAGQVRGMVGEGLERLLEKAVGPDRAAEGVTLFRERYEQVAVELTELMPDVREVLDALEAASWRMILTSNKPARFSKMILEAKSISRFFQRIEGPDAEAPPKPDPAMLIRALRALRITPSEAVVVGDMEIDVRFARAAGCRAALVPGGSAAPGELARAGADVVLEDLRALPSWLDRLRTPRATTIPS